MYRKRKRKQREKERSGDHSHFIEEIPASLRHWQEALRRASTSMFT